MNEFKFKSELFFTTNKQTNKQMLIDLDSYSHSHSINFDDLILLTQLKSITITSKTNHFNPMLYTIICLLSSSVLEELSIINIELSCNKVDILIECFEHKKFNFKSLTIKHCVVSVLGFSSICVYLKSFCCNKNSLLKYLDLSSNCSIHLNELIEFLTKSITLKVFRITDNTRIYGGNDKYILIRLFESKEQNIYYNNNITKSISCKRKQPQIPRFKSLEDEKRLELILNNDYFIKLTNKKIELNNIRIIIQILLIPKEIKRLGGLSQLKKLPIELIKLIFKCFV